MKRDIFPLDQQLKIWERHWSEQVAKQAVWLSGLVTYEQAGEILRKIGGVEISNEECLAEGEALGRRNCGTGKDAAGESV